MIQVSRSGAALAALAMSLAIAGTGLMASPAEAASKVKCVGANACKGQSACATASSSCKGQNACKGQGWVSATAKKCKALGGKPA